jgi:hypothetical protein
MLLVISIIIQEQGLSVMMNFKLFWHMIIRGHLEETLLAIDSLQGLYDGIVVAVDDRDDSDEVFEAISYYPNIHAYRQKFSGFGRYDLARQDCLEKVPYDVTYIGWSDSDEILVTDPYKVRKWLFDTQPEAVNCGIHYVYAIGGHEAGQTYRNGRVRIWKQGTRVWSRPCHEYPTPINGIDEPVIGDIIFNHIKQDNSDYRADHHIELMQTEIDSGNLGWRFFQAKEYEIKGEKEKARQTLIEYVKSGETNFLTDAIVKICESYLSDRDYIGLNEVLSSPYWPEHPMRDEYLAIGCYYGNNKILAKKWHERAKSLDTDGNYTQLFANNDQYFD